MDILLFILSGILILIGVIGCLLPIIPGPPLCYAGLLLLLFIEPAPFSTNFLIIMAVITVAAQGLDYIVPTYGTKKYGGSKAGVTGSVIGLIVGTLFFPPFGIILGPMVGAFVAELLSGRERKDALRSAWGSFVGFLFGTLIKLIACFIMAYYFIKAIINLF